MKNKIKQAINDFSNNSIIIKEIENKYKNTKIKNIDDIIVDIDNIQDNWNIVNKSMNNIRETLNVSVHGHENAKRQVERIIGQWITGEQTGYCFGFEGPPGVGKTSLARKGLASCLKDENGNPRPFSFIAVGGASNGSTIAGHNYTYVGSTWGKIVDILIEKKCMNPIIFIDELDKISRTENGKEIIGILTHLIDTTQNEQFQDKYFSGIDLDLSKALFIFSYNDVSAIDRILLDRIHRIKFKHLTLQDKLTICKDYILPEYYDKFNINNIDFTDDILKYIIQHYTNESGVRKLKEILFEILSEINLEILQNHNEIIEINISIENIKKKYLKDKREIKEKNIHNNSQIGIINGLWANSLGMGGIIPIESSFMPSNTFLELNLTGLQGDVMKESMNVAKTLAWKLTPNSIKTKLIKKFKTTKMQCIHIHCPEGAVPKDGPSAGTAITTCIYSLFNCKKIKNKVAITGEINLQGSVTAIGGLELKILGGIRAGVKTFIFPQENKDDFDKIKSNMKDLTIFDNIEFISVSSIQQVLDIVFEE
jgi:endopeptidase La